MIKSQSKPLVLVTYVEAGMGHIVTAEAISGALKEKYSDELNIVDSYILRDSDNPVLCDYEKFLVNEVQKQSKYFGYSHIQMTAMHIGGSKNTLRLVHNTVFRKATYAVVREYRKINPDVIVLTHYFTQYAAEIYRDKYNPDCKVVLYCPDNNVHGWWSNRVDKIYTNNPLATKDARFYRFPDHTIREVFYPTRSSVVNANESKEFYREKFGIPKDKFAVVVADGVYAKAKTKKVCYELMKSDAPLTICALTGKNEELYGELMAIKDKQKPNITLLPFGFLKNAPELYGACDLFITKAGPNAVLDSVMMGTPVIIDYYGTPIEQATKRLFIDLKRCGYFIRNVKKIRETVEFLVRNPREVSELRERLRFFDKTKNGAGEIAEDIYENVCKLRNN